MLDIQSVVIYIYNFMLDIQSFLNFINFFPGEGMSPMDQEEIMNEWIHSSRQRNGKDIPSTGWVWRWSYRHRNWQLSNQWGIYDNGRLHFPKYSYFLTCLLLAFVLLCIQDVWNGSVRLHDFRSTAGGTNFLWL